MRVAAIYDVHGNLAALEAVLADVAARRADLVLVGGDAVLGPFPSETLQRLEELGGAVRFIRGNTDRNVTAPVEASGPWAEIVNWVRGRLTGAQRDRVRAWPERLTLDVTGFGPTLFCHGTPRSDEEIVTRLTPEPHLLEVLAGVEEPVVVCGHTHMQFDRRAGSIRLVNAGSVGMPYQGSPGAYWTMLGPDVEPMRTGYDFERAAAAITASSYPDAERFARDVLAPPAAEVMTERFERMAEAQRPARPR